MNKTGEADYFGIPQGPIDAIDHGSDLWNGYYCDNGDAKTGGDRIRYLFKVFREAGVDLGPGDEQMIGHIATVRDWSEFAAIASWLVRVGNIDL